MPLSPSLYVVRPGGGGWWDGKREVMMQITAILKGFLGIRLLCDFDCLRTFFTNISSSIRYTTTPLVI